MEGTGSECVCVCVCVCVCGHGFSMEVEARDGCSIKAAVGRNGANMIKKKIFIFIYFIFIKRSLYPDSSA